MRAAVKPYAYGRLQFANCDDLIVKPWDYDGFQTNHEERSVSDGEKADEKWRWLMSLVRSDEAW